MLFAKLVFGFQKLARRRGMAALRGLHSPQQLRRILQRERARTDRTGRGFCLLTFTPRDPATSQVSLLRLAVILKRRLRCTDEVGWLDHQRIAVLLPDTPTWGAWKVADDVCLSFPLDELPPLCAVYGYPTEPWSGEASLDEANGGPLELDRPVRAMETLFMQGMPLWKRALDVVGAALAIILLSPLFVTVAIAIKLSSPGPVFFRQYRGGLGGKPFVMYKFRSMVNGAEAKQRELLPLNEQDGPAFKIRNDPRVTALGRFLRSTSIDELPQLWNVLRGEMSLVGPRPLPCRESDACAAWQRRRLDVTPGLTCIWQVNGRSQVSFDEWMRMDLRYVRARSLQEDLKLLVQTVPAVLLRKGVS